MAWAGNAGRRRRMAVWRMSHIGNIGVTRNRSRGLPGTVHFSQEVTSLWIVLGDSNGIKFTCSFHALSLSSSPANYSIILKELELVSQLMSSVRYTLKFWQVLTFLVLLFGFSLFNLIFVIFLADFCVCLSKQKRRFCCCPTRFGSLFLLLRLRFPLIYRATRFHRRFLFLYTWWPLGVATRFYQRAISRQFLAKMRAYLANSNLP